MLKLNRNAWFWAALLSAMSAFALAAAPAHAQRVPEVDLFNDFNGGGGRTSLSINRFALAGNGCPDRNSTAALIEQRNGGAVIRLQFDRGNGRRFQVEGPAAGTRSCTARLQLRNDSNRQLDVSLDRVAEGVRSVNRVNQGQLIVRSQFQLNDASSNVRAFRLQNNRNANATSVQLNGFNLRARVGGALNVAAIVQLQLQGQNDAALRLENLAMELRFQSSNSGGFGTDPFSGGGFSTGGLGGDPLAGGGLGGGDPFGGGF